MSTPTINGKYMGELRCDIKHNNSGQHITTDAPKDNNGKGEAFSPTDLVAAALGTCMITIIGIRAKSKGLDIGKPEFSIYKHMQSYPRKIDHLTVEIIFKVKIEPDDRNYLENEAKKCPVALSLNDSIEQDIRFKYV